MGPEQIEQEREIIKEIWAEWKKVLDDRGEEDEDRETLDYEFVIDRRKDTESRFSADDINVYSLKNTPLEEWIPNRVPNAFRTGIKEEWITIKISPKDPYHPKLGHWYWQAEDEDFYFTEMLDIFISNHGRGFEFTQWYLVLRPDQHEKQKPTYSYLIALPKPEEIDTTFTEEPEEVSTEPFQLLKGQSLERLYFLTTKLQRGEIIDASTPEA